MTSHSPYCGHLKSTVEHSCDGSRDCLLCTCNVIEAAEQRGREAGVVECAMRHSSDNMFQEGFQEGFLEATQATILRVSVALDDLYADRSSALERREVMSVVNALYYE